ncbi:hypothetical protein MnTg02_02528 [bacterium MnTg02]|nr:hypothetical protein MnTg02_02528 [bacterium MnTg02]
MTTESPPKEFWLFSKGRVRVNIRFKVVNTKNGRLCPPAAICGAVMSVFLLMAPGTALAQETPTQAPIVGNIESFTLDAGTDVYRGGIMVVGGQEIVIPSNIVLEMPANFLTPVEFFNQAPGTCAGVQSGLAAADTCDRAVTGVATILANRAPDGRIIAGEVFLERGQESLSGIVTFIDYQRGYFRVAGDLGADTGGTVVRINDPDARHSIQVGPAAFGCAGFGTVDNCSADVRFTLDSDNYTITFSTGYPACIPSRRVAGNQPAGDARVANRVLGAATAFGNFTRANANGRNDTFCPHQNRDNETPVADSFRFAPLQVGDHIAANGNTETLGGFTFLSAHTMVIHVALTTTPGDPDYIIWEEVEWDTAGFQNERVRMLMIGFSTLPTNAPNGVEVYALDVNPDTGANHERIIASVAGCEAGEGVGTCTAQGIPPTGAGIFRIRYDVDFDPAILGIRRSPCQHLNAADGDGFVTSPCPAAFTLADEVNVIVPITRELIGRSRNKITCGALGVNDSVDLTGNEAPNGEYLTPVGIGHPEFVEINLAAIQTPFIFEGQTWNLDRRTGPVGCNEGTDCSADTAVALNPFPQSCLDPADQTDAPPVPLAAFRDLITTPRQGAGPLPLPTAGCP